MEPVTTAALIFQCLYGAIKGRQRRINRYTVSRFQCLYGAIKGAWPVSFVVALPIFQCLYGAIKGSLGDYFGLPTDDFNACMVRLKASLLQKAALRLHISMPVWCD